MDYIFYMCKSRSSVMVVSHKVFVYFLFYMTFANFTKISCTFPCRTKDRGRDDILTREPRTERGLPCDVLTPPQTKNSKSKRIKYSRFNCRTRYTYVRTHCFFQRFSFIVSVVLEHKHFAGERPLWIRALVSQRKTACVL